MGDVAKTDPLIEFYLAECSKIVHPGTHSCTRGYLNVFGDGFFFGTKYFTPLFFVAALLQRKGPKETILKTIQSTVTSATFLGLLGGSTAPVQCFFRNLTGQNRPWHTFVGGALGGILALSVEEKARRPELVLYVMNHAAEASYRSLARRGFLPSLEFGDVYLFCLSAGAISYFYRNHFDALGKFGDFFHFLTNPNEPKPTIEKEKEKEETQETQNEGKQENGNHNHSKMNGTNHTSQERVCTHRELSCTYKGLKGFSRGFIIGFLFKGGFALLSAIVAHKLWKKPISKSMEIISHVLTEKSVWMGSMLGGCFISIFHGLDCFLKNNFWNPKTPDEKQPAWHSIVVGLVSGLSIFFNRSVEATQYLLFKSLQASFNLLVQKGIVKPLPFGDYLLFSLATGTLFFSSVFEPYNLRPSFWRFVFSASGGRYKQFHDVARAWNPVAFNASGIKY